MLNVSANVSTRALLPLVGRLTSVPPPTSGGPSYLWWTLLPLVVSLTFRSIMLKVSANVSTLVKEESLNMMSTTYLSPEGHHTGEGGELAHDEHHMPVTRGASR